MEALEGAAHPKPINSTTQLKTVVQLFTGVELFAVKTVHISMELKQTLELK